MKWIVLLLTTGWNMTKLQAEKSAIPGRNGGGGGIWRRGVALEVAFNFPFSCHCSPCSPFHHLSPSCLGCHCFPSGPLYTRELATPGLIQPLAHRRPEFIWERDLIASNWPIPASNTIVNDTEHYDELFCVN